MKSSKKSATPNHTRWFLFMNISIAVLLICAAGVLKKSTSNYSAKAHYDRGYIAQAKAETDADTLKHGLIYTEAARATAYRSVLNLSNGASIIWLIVAAAFVMNAVFFFRMHRNQQLMLAQSAAA